MKRRFFTILTILSLLLCVAVVLWMYGMKSSVQRRLESRIASGATSFDFAAETPFSWDRMFVFGPYTSQSDVEKSLGFQWPDYRRSSIQSSDSVCLVVFVENRSVVHWYDQPNSINLGWLANATGYAPSEAKFIVDRSGGRVELKKPTVAGELTTRPSN